MNGEIISIKTAKEISALKSENKKLKSENKKLKKELYKAKKKTIPTMIAIPQKVHEALSK